MPTPRKTTPPPRNAAPPPAPDEERILRLHATTALSRIMRGDHDGARDLLAGLPPADTARVAAAAERLAATARLVLADFASGAA